MPVAPNQQSEKKSVVTQANWFLQIVLYESLKTSFLWFKICQLLTNLL